MGPKYYKKKIKSQLDLPFMSIMFPGYFLRERVDFHALQSLVLPPLDIALQGVPHMAKEAVRSWINKNYNLLKAIGKQCSDSI